MGTLDPGFQLCKLSFHIPRLSWWGYPEKLNLLKV